MLSTHPKGLIGELSKSRERLYMDHLSGLPGTVVVRRCTDWVEGVIKRLYGEALARYPVYGPVGLVAVGGFGRGELNLQSDVDLLFIYPAKIKKEMERLAEMVLYPLWDLKLDVGHAARTLPECMEMGKEDFSVLVSLLTARTVAGDGEQVERLHEMLDKALHSLKARRAFLEKVLKADREREIKYGNTPYLLEPNLKEGEGGLRDIHTINWVGLGCFKAGKLYRLVEQGLMTDEEVAFIGESREFLWRVRNHLHYLAKGHDDQLTFEWQVEVARFLGYSDRNGLSGVDWFMRDFYTRAHHLRNIQRIFFERSQDRLALSSSKSRKLGDDFLVRDEKLHLTDPGSAKRNPGLLMKLFAVSAQSGIKVSHHAREEVRQRRYLVDEAFRRDPEVRQDFFTVIQPPKPGSGAIFAFHGSGLLNAYIPELDSIFQLPQHDAFHTLTVDVHLLETVHLLAEMKSGEGGATLGGEVARDLLNQLSRPRLLCLAALIHDLGKGGGKGHSERGAKMAQPILDRLGLKKEEADLVSFLIRNHLLLMETALRRDIHDENMLFSLAGRIGDEERLAMLFLLTVADSNATGPRAWSSWQATLLAELYFKVLAIMIRKDVDVLETPERLALLTDTVTDLLKGRLDRERVEYHLDNLPTQYRLSTEPEVVAEQMLLQESLGGRRMVFDVQAKKKEGYCQFTVVSKRRRGVFSRVAGVLTLNGLNILGAQVHNRKDYATILVFQTELPVDRYAFEDKKQKVGRDMEKALSGRLALHVRVAQRLAQVKSDLARAPKRPVEVEVDNSISDFHTVVEVAANDRLGLLYDITKVFYDLDLEIHLAKISTKVDQVFDAFYVTGLDGGKVEDEEQISEVREALKAILE